MKRQFLLLVGLLLVGWARGQTAAYATPVVLNSVGRSVDVNIGNIRHIEYSVGEAFALPLNFAGPVPIDPAHGPALHFTCGFLQPTTKFPYVVQTQEAFDDQFTLHCYPVPTSDWLTVETNYSGFTRAEFSDLLGRSVRTVPFDYAPLDCRALPAGTYFVRFSSENHPIFKTIKIFKQ